MTEQTISRETLEKMLGRVTALLAKADSTEFLNEEAALRSKAHELMQKYRIAEEDLIAEDATSVMPEYAEFEFCSTHNPFRMDYLRMLFHIADHCGVMTAYSTNWHTGDITVMAVGYSGDLRMLSWLLNATRLVFKERLEPEVRADLSEAENVYRLRAAGIERQRVARLIWGEEIGRKASAHARVGKIYKDECERRGEYVALDGKGLSLKGFRAAYAAEFVRVISFRLWEARQGTETTQGAIQLHGRSERISDAFYTRFPSLRPDDLPVLKEDRSKPTKPRPMTKAEEKALYNQLHSPAAVAGKHAGRAAAEEVEIARTKPTGRLAE